MIAKVRTLNFYDDVQIDTLLKDLETEVEKFKGDRNKDVIVCKLNRIVEVSADEFTPPDFNPSISYLEV